MSIYVDLELSHELRHRLLFAKQIFNMFLSLEFNRL